MNVVSELTFGESFRHGLGLGAVVGSGLFVVAGMVADPHWLAFLAIPFSVIGAALMTTNRSIWMRLKNKGEL